MDCRSLFAESEDEDDIDVVSLEKNTYRPERHLMIDGSSSTSQRPSWSGAGESSSSDSYRGDAMHSPRNDLYTESGAGRQLHRTYPVSARQTSVIVKAEINCDHGQGQSSSTSFETRRKRLLSEGASDGTSKSRKMPADINGRPTIPGMKVSSKENHTAQGSRSDQNPAYYGAPKVLARNSWAPLDWSETQPSVESRERVLHNDVLWSTEANHSDTDSEVDIVSLGGPSESHATVPAGPSNSDCLHIGSHSIVKDLPLGQFYFYRLRNYKWEKKSYFSMRFIQKQTIFLMNQDLAEDAAFWMMVQPPQIYNLIGLRHQTMKRMKTVMGMMKMTLIVELR